MKKFHQVTNKRPHPSRSFGFTNLKACPLTNKLKT